MDFLQYRHYSICSNVPSHSRASHLQSRICQYCRQPGICLLQEVADVRYCSNRIDRNNVQAFRPAISCFSPPQLQIAQCPSDLEALVDSVGDALYKQPTVRLLLKVPTTGLYYAIGNSVEEIVNCTRPGFVLAFHCPCCMRYANLLRDPKLWCSRFMFLILRKIQLLTRI